MTMASCILVLENPPQGPSVADGYAERCNHGAELRMKKTMTQLEKKKQQIASQLENQKKIILKDLNNIRHSKLKKNYSENSLSNLLESEKLKLRKQYENTRVDDGGSDGDFSEDSFDEKSECFSDDGSVDSIQGDVDNRKSLFRSPRACQRHRTSYQERSREDRITNLHRRFSAQVKKDSVVEVKRTHVQRTQNNKIK